MRERERERFIGLEFHNIIWKDVKKGYKQAGGCYCLTFSELSMRWMS